MSARQILSLVRRLARGHGLAVLEMVGRGKGSHCVYLILDGGREAGRITVTDHPGDLSWTVLRDIEQKLAHLFGERWTEKR